MPRGGYRPGGGRPPGSSGTKRPHQTATKILLVDGVVPPNSDELAGQPKQVRSHEKTVAFKDAQVRDALARIDAELPLPFLIATMRTREAPFWVRLDAAKHAAPYIHPRLSAAAVMMGGPGSQQQTDNAELYRRMTPAERAQMRSLLEEAMARAVVPLITGGEAA